MIGVVGSDLALYAIGRRIRSHSVLNGRAALVISLLLVRAWRARRAREQSRL